MRLVEAYGLWHSKVWAEWLAALSGEVFAPIESFELSVSPRWLGMTVMVVDLLALAFMIRAARPRRWHALDQNVV